MEKSERVVAALSERLEMHDNSRRAVQESLHEICNGLRKFIDEMEEGVNKRLEEEFTKEDNRLQSALNELKECMSTAKEDDARLSKAIQSAVSDLFTIQTYELVECGPDERAGRGEGFSKRFELRISKQPTPEGEKLRKLTIIRPIETNQSNSHLEATGDASNENDKKESIAFFSFAWKVFACGEEEEEEGKGNEKKDIPLVKPGGPEHETAHQTMTDPPHNEKENGSSDSFGGSMTPELPAFTWEECPAYVEEGRRYSVDEKNPKTAVKAGTYCSTIIGKAHIPARTETTWDIRVLESRERDCYGIFVGVAPSDIDQNDGCNYNSRGWYLHCFNATLFSGPPHNYECKDYGPRKKDGQHIHTGDSVGVVMDTSKGDLSFTLNGVNLGVAYEGIPLDKPLVPCVLLVYEGDSIELGDYKVKEKPGIMRDLNVVPVPSSITTKSASWDSITLTWGPVKGASFYQVEVDGTVQERRAATTLTRKLLPGVEHIFRVRAVNKDSVSEWSAAVKGRARNAPDFSDCAWKECRNNTESKKKYSLGLFSPKVATKINGDDWCAIVGNAPLPPNKATSWDIKALRSMYNGHGIYIGAVPFDIKVNKSEACHSYGWYLHCYDLSLSSGPPHNYRGKAYGLRKVRNGEYMRTGDVAGVVMDTTKGELSFILKNVYHGVAYEGVPLDKPLVPCVLLKWEGDSVELKTRDLKSKIISF